MSLIIKDTGEDYVPMTPGLQQAVCSHLVDLKWQDTPWGYKHRIMLCFEFVEKMQDGRPFMLSKEYNPSLNEKAGLRQDLRQWRGKDFTEQELEGFDLETVVGVNCMINVIEVTRKKINWPSIGSFSPLMRGLPKIEPIGQPIPEWIQKKRDKGIEESEAKRDKIELAQYTEIDEQQSNEPLPF